MDQEISAEHDIAEVIAEKHLENFKPYLPKPFWVQSKTGLLQWRMTCKNDAVKRYNNFRRTNNQCKLCKAYISSRIVKYFRQMEKTKIDCEHGFLVYLLAVANEINSLSANLAICSNEQVPFYNTQICSLLEEQDNYTDRFCSPSCKEIYYQKPSIKW